MDSEEEEHTRADAEQDAATSRNFYTTESTELRTLDQTEEQVSNERYKDHSYIPNRIPAISSSPNKTKPELWFPATMRIFVLNSIPRTLILKLYGSSKPKLHVL